MSWTGKLRILPSMSHYMHSLLPPASPSSNILSLFFYRSLYCSPALLPFLQLLFFSFMVLVDPPVLPPCLSPSDSGVIDGTLEASVSSHPPPWSTSLSLSLSFTHTDNIGYQNAALPTLSNFTGFILPVSRSLPCV